MLKTRYGICTLCEATCGIAVDVEGDRIVKIRGDDDDPFSRGYICPKAVALMDIHRDPDRLRHPVRREGNRWVEVGWSEALDAIVAGLVGTQERHGKDAVALYFGNSTSHSYSALLFILLVKGSLGSKNIYSSNSVDGLPRKMVSSLLYGNQATIPIPDLHRTNFLLVLGANPAVSNGSIMTAPDVARRLKDLRERGGRLVVMDPRRTETAELADTHHFLRPGTDALLLAAMLRTIFDEGLGAPGRLALMIEGLDTLRAALGPFSPEAVASPTGVGAEAIRALARDFARAPSAVCYGRMGTCVQEFGAVSTWLIDALNVVTGNLDRPGGAMFTTPALDLGRVARLLGQAGLHGRWRSRVSGYAEFDGELPVAAFAEEMETPGLGQIRALITHAGNPVLSLPNGGRLDRALAGLDLMVSIDLYVNETTRHAHYILPPTLGLERDHYPILSHALAVRNTAHYAEAMLAKPPGVRHEWEILLELAARLAERRGGFRSVVSRAPLALLSRIGPQGILALLLRLGGRVLLDDLRGAPHGIDLGPLEPRLPAVLSTPGKRIRLAPDALVRDLGRLKARLAEAPAAASEELLLIGRRSLRSNNSWMHNSLRLVKGKPRCTLLMHPSDAAQRGLAAGQTVRVASRTGAIAAPLEISDEIMPGVVSLPHGWGHDRPDVRLSVAQAHAGVSVNDVTDDRRIDAVSGTSSLSGVPVTVTAAARASASASASATIDGGSLGRG
jgi:anaerobic selenocysteine-containing dehydrogenase